MFYVTLVLRIWFQSDVENGIFLKKVPSERCKLISDQSLPLFFTGQSVAEGNFLSNFRHTHFVYPFQVTIQ